MSLRRVIATIIVTTFFLGLLLLFGSPVASTIYHVKYPDILQIVVGALHVIGGLIVIILVIALLSWAFNEVFD